MPGQARLENHPHVFLPRHIKELIGISDRQLRYWKKTGFFVPVQVKQQLRYNFVDFCMLTCVKNMRSHGVSVQKMRERHVPQLLGNYRSALASGYVVQDLGFTLSNDSPVLFAGRLFLSEDHGMTSPVLFSQLWEAVREIRVRTRLDTLESTAL